MAKSTMTVDPKLVRYELNKGNPAVRLFIERPAEAAMDQWYLTPRDLICLIGGPGDTDYLLVYAVVPKPAGWREKVDATGGATIIFGGIDDTGPFAQLT